MSGHVLTILILLTAIAPIAIWIVQRTHPDRYIQVIDRTWMLLGTIAKHRWLLAFGSASGVLAVRALLLPVWPIPQPSIVDEFSYLLLGETFASGKLAN